MTISSIGNSNGAARSNSKQPGTNSAADAAAFAKILDAFKKEAAKTPAQRARDEVLKKHNLTEDDYKMLPSEKKKAIDAEIATAVQRVMRADKGKGFKGAETAATVVPGSASGSPDFLSA